MLSLSCVSFFFGQRCRSCSVNVLNCIFHVRDFFFNLFFFAAVTIVQFQHSVNSQSRQSLSCELLRFLAYWATAIVSSLIQRSRFLALTQEIKFFHKVLLWSPSVQSKERCVGRKKIKPWEKSCRCCRAWRSKSYRVISFIMLLCISSPTSCCDAILLPPHLFNTWYW